MGHGYSTALLGGVQDPRVPCLFCPETDGLCLPAPQCCGVIFLCPTTPFPFRLCSGCPVGFESRFGFVVLCLLAFYGVRNKGAGKGGPSAPLTWLICFLI